MSVSSTGKHFALVVLVSTCLVAVMAQDPPVRDVDLEETVVRRLVQVDVSLSGPPEVLSALTPDDFTLKVMTRKIPEFTVDRVCRQPEGAPSAVETEAEESQPAIRETVLPTQVAPTTFLFYFDHNSMTFEGNQRAPQVAKELIASLIKDGNRGMVVSNGRQVTTYQELTEDPDALIAGVDEMYVNHVDWWDPTQPSEELMLNQLMELLHEQPTDIVARQAKLFASQEVWFAERSYRRFTMVLGRLADLPQPKAVLFFSDRLRQHPGEHYLSYFGFSQTAGNTANPWLVGLRADSEFAALGFDAVVNEANAHGARLYTVQAQGMTTIGGSLTNRRADDPMSVNVTSGTRHITDAQDTLQTMASETGGDAFLRGVKPKRIAQTIEQGLACIYLVSFDAADFPRNQPIPVAIKVKQSEVKVSHRGQVYIQGPKKRLTSRLMAAFTAPEAIKNEGALRGSLIPIGFEDGKFSALVQMAVEGASIDDATWDLGVSVLSRERVREDSARRVTVAESRTPVVFEHIVEFPPGPYDIILVAHEIKTDEIATARLEGSWPDPDEIQAEVGPIAVMQPTAAVFLRGDGYKTRGALDHGQDLPVQTGRPTAIMSVVCWERSLEGRLRVERDLVGETTVSFPPIDIESLDELCAPILDQIPADTMGGGDFVYELRVRAEGEPLAFASRRFAALTAPANPE